MENTEKLVRALQELTDDGYELYREELLNRLNGIYQLLGYDIEYNKNASGEALSGIIDDLIEYSEDFNLKESDTHL